MLKSFTASETEIFYTQYGEDMAGTERPLIIWGHGWGQDHTAFTDLIDTLKNHADHIALDLPGFGQSPVPPGIWSTADYATAFHDLIAHQNRPVFWAGHSFGGRVGLQLGANPPENLKGLVLIAAAGLKRKRSPHQIFLLWLKVRIFKTFKFLIKFGLPEKWVFKNFTNNEYKNAGEMRKIFVKTVNENLSEEAQKNTLPTLLLYGEKDTETPPEIGQRLHAMIPNSKLIVLEDLDHYSILTEGRHILAKTMRDFIAAQTQR